MSRPKRKLPGPRRLEVFVKVAVEGRSVADVASEFGITKRSVYSMTSDVRRWLREHGAVWTEIDEQVRQASLTCELYIARLEHQWQELMNAWNRSTKPQETKKARFNAQGQLQHVDISNRSQTGHVPYLIQAQRILETITAIRARNPLPSKEHNDVRLASVEQRRTRLAEILKLYGPGGGAEGSSGVVDEGSPEPQSPGNARAA